MNRSLFYLITFAMVFMTPLVAQFDIGGDERVNPDDFTITTFADGLNFPVGMVVLPDQSILVAVSNGSSFWSSNSGSLIQLIDHDNDGIADEENVLVDNVPGGKLSALKMIDNWIFTTGQGTPITLYHITDDAPYVLTKIGEIEINYSGSWLHPNSALEVRNTPGSSDQYDLFIHLGSEVNFATTTRKLWLSSDIGLADSIAGDAISIAHLTVNGDELDGTGLSQLATGLRSAAGMAFDEDGNMWIQDNGIDGLEDPNEPHSADEINFLPVEDIGGEIADYGFPDHYIAYRTGEFVGGGGIAPLVAFQPIPDPFTGDEAEGPNDIAFAPPHFPEGLNDGMFVGFHGKFSLGGLANEENPLVYIDLNTYEYFHFVSIHESNVGHLIGLTVKDSSLFVADFSPGGGLGNSDANSGIIYRIHHTPNMTSIADNDAPHVADFHLSDAYPNPFNPSTTIEYHIASSATVSLEVYNVHGQLVRSLVTAQNHTPGSYQTRWDGLDDYGQQVAAGLYFYKFSADNFSQVKRMLFVK